MRDAIRQANGGDLASESAELLKPLVLAGSRLVKVAALTGLAEVLKTVHIQGIADVLKLPLSDNHGSVRQAAALCLAEAAKIQPDLMPEVFSIFESMLCKPDGIIISAAISGMVGNPPEKESTL